MINNPDGSLLMYEECFIALKLTLIKRNSKFYGHQLLEYLAPGWLQRQIERCNEEDSPNERLIGSLENLEKIRSSNGEVDRDKRVIKGFTKWKMDSGWRQQSDDIRAVIVCK